MSGLKRAASADRPLVGTWLSVGHPAVGEMVGHLDYDFAALDLEHAPSSLETAENVLRGIDAAPGATETLVRVAGGGGDPDELKRVLDLAPDGVMVPMVDTPEEAEAVVEATRYPPEGVRGLGLSRATGYGLHTEEYVDTVDDELARIVQLESERAVENAADIAAVEGVDGIFLGPIDFSMALGAYGEWDDERFTDAVDRVRDAAAEAGVGFGTLAVDAESRESRLAWGVDFLVAGVDAIHLLDGAGEALDHCERLIDDE